MKFEYENLQTTVFPGYYNSILVDDFYYGYAGDVAPDGFYFDFREGGFEKYAKLTNEEWVWQMKQYIKNDNPADVNILEYKGMWSPKYYNYTTDKIRFEVEFDVKKLEKYCFCDYTADFDSYLNKHWSSYSGFCSFVPNSIKWFKNKYDTNNDINTLYNVMLEFYFLQQIDFETVMSRTMDKEYEHYDGLVGLFDSNHEEHEWEYDNESDSIIAC